MSDRENQRLVRRLELAHVLPPNVDSAARKVRNWRHSHEIEHARELYLTQVAAFFYPALENMEERDICKRGIISVAIVNREKFSRIILALVDESMHGSQLVRDFLASRYVPVYFGSLDNGEKIEEFLNDYWSTGLRRLRAAPVAVENKVTNISERWLLTELQELLGTRISRKLKKDIQQVHPRDSLVLLDEIREYSARQKEKFYVYHEMSLGAIVKFQAPTTSKQRPEDYEFLAKRRCDALVATPGPNGIPLLVVEYDGPYHEEARKQELDKTRDKLVNEAGLSVFRIAYHNPNMSDAKPTPNKRKFQRFLRVVVGDLAEALYEAIAPPPPTMLKIIRKMLHDRSIESRSVLSRDQRLAVFHKYFQTEYYYDDMQRQLEDELWRADIQKEYFDMTNLVERNGGRVECINLSIPRDEQNRWIMARGRFHFLEQDRIVDVETPRFFCSLHLPHDVHLPGFSFDTVLDRGAVDVLKWMVRREA